MSEKGPPLPGLQPLVGQVVVLDTKGPFVYIGTLAHIEPESLRLTDVDVHDIRQTPTSTDRYLIEAAKHGLRTNRREVTVMAREIVSVSPLSAIILY